MSDDLSPAAQFAAAAAADAEAAAAAAAVAHVDAAAAQIAPLLAAVDLGSECAPPAADDHSSAAAAFESAVDSAVASNAGNDSDGASDNGGGGGGGEPAAHTPQARSKPAGATAKKQIDLADEELFPSLGSPAGAKARPAAWGARSVAGAPGAAEGGPQSMAAQLRPK
ncbi:hypothetical protein H4R19_002187, partial [Coemansia spiralis]